MRAKFVDSALRSLKPHRVKYDVHDPEGGPLVLRVSTDGRKTWMASYASPTGVMQLRPIGKYPMMSIAQARQQARAVVGGDGEDGADESDDGDDGGDCDGGGPDPA